MNTLINKITEEIYEHIKNNSVTECILQIKNIHGNNEYSPRACKSGSSVYILYSNKDVVLYAGETGASIKSRCFGDGDGAHFKKAWFKAFPYTHLFNN